MITETIVFLTRKLVNEIKDVFSSCHERGTGSKIFIFRAVFTDTTLSTSLKLL